MHFRLLNMFFLTTCCLTNGFGQPGKPATWSFSTKRVSESEFVLILSATLSPGWHLYSQHLEAGGPLPTRISFDPGNCFVLVGETREEGTPVQFFDSIYEMNITWHADSVSFHQNIRLSKPAATVTGTIEYMTCNEHRCIPDKKDFTINIPPRAKTP
jgi:thiol:disulfide interchange protein DsbD